jgi:uncharacterized protein YecT (DUF1311 family)
MRYFTHILVCLCAISQCIGQDEVKQTLDQALKQADANLNNVYAKVCRLLNERELETMKKAQRSWLGYCNAEASMLAGVTSEGGSSYSNDFIHEKTRLINIRVSQLLYVEQRLKNLRE